MTILGKGTIHHMRYPSKDRTFQVTEDTVPVCGKCHEIIRNHEEMQVPELTKKELRGMINVYFRKEKARTRAWMER